MCDLSWLIQYLKDKCYRYLGKEHSPDEGCNRTHCHFAIEYKHTKQALAKFLNSNKIVGSDNYGILSKTDDKKDYDFKKLSIYIIKGRLDGTIRSNLDEETLGIYEQEWRDYKDDKRTQKEIKSVKYDEWNIIERDGTAYFKNQFDENKRENNYRTIVFDDVRRWVMRWYWDRDGRLPHPPSYKRNASSLYYSLSLKGYTCADDFETMNQIMEKWY